MIACSEGSTPLFVVARFPYVKIGLRLVRMLIDFKMCIYEPCVAEASPLFHYHEPPNLTVHMFIIYNGRDVCVV